ncbi:MAG: transglycosylase domain-containing protein [Beijerinckiaceae bacterium]
MNGNGTSGFWTRLRRRARDVDARLDHGLYSFFRKLRNAYIGFSVQLDRLKVTGTRRFAVEVAGEGLTLGLGAGIVMVALAMPAFKETADDNWLKKQDLAVVFLDRYGVEIGKRGIKHDDSTKLEDMPDHFVRAVLSTEDRRFYEHFGIDAVGTLRALMANTKASGVVQGGSSITQQLAKNLFLTNERSIERKIKEAFLAVWLESRLSKDEILKLYLDRAYMGGGAFGATAAAEFYFGKPLGEITLAEGAMLAGLFKAPTKYAPHVNLPAARARASDVLSNMVEANFLTEGQIVAARRNPATPIDRRRDSTADYYLDWAFGEARKMMEQNKLGDDRVITVKTSLDMNLQRRAEAVIETMLRQHGDEYEADQGAAVVMDSDGAVRAIVGGRDYGVSQYNRATDALRQPGSAFKPFVYASALAAGKISRNSNVVDRSICLGNWCPQNYNRSFAGAMPLTSAVARSINTIPVAMTVAIGHDQHPNHTFRAARAGRDKVVRLLRDSGVAAPLKDTPSMPIGSVEMSVMEMAMSYSVFPNLGRKAEGYAALEIHNSRGEMIYRRDRDGPKTVQVVSRQVAEDMNYLLSKVPEEGTGRRAALPGIRSAGKTGTTSAYRDAWYVGYTGNLTTAVWFGNDDNTSTSDMTGGSLPAMAWKEIMTYAHANAEIAPLAGLTPADKVAPPVAGAASTAAGAFAVVSPARPAQLSRRAAEAIGAIDAQFRGAEARRSRGPERRADGGFEILGGAAGTGTSTAR